MSKRHLGILLILFSLSLFSELSSAATRHVYDKQVTAENACQDHQFSGGCSHNPGVYSFFYHGSPGRGVYHFLYLNCPEGAVFIGNEGFWWDNNRGPFPQPPRPYCGLSNPDLALDLYLDGDSQRLAGDTLVFFYEVTNVGSTEFGQSVPLQFVLRGPVGGTEIEVDFGNVSIPALNSGASSSGELSVVLPITFVPGDYELKGIVNPNRIDPPIEADYGNNEISLTISIVAPDLVAVIESSAVRPIVLFPGQSIDTTLSLGNISQLADYDDSVVGGIFLSEDQYLDIDDNPLFATQSYANMVAGQTEILEQPITISENTFAGDYQVFGAVNPADYFLFKDNGEPQPVEANFENNASEPFAIKVELPKVEIEICVGNPISTNSGRKFETEIDYQGTGPFPLQSARFYSSRPGNSRGWNFSYSRRLFVKDNEASTDVILVFDGGQRYEFIDIDNRGFSDADVPGLITRSAHGFNYLDEAGTIHQFNHAGKLIGLISLTGFTQTLSYAGDQLSQISDQFGKSLQLTYNLNGQIDTLTTPDNRIYHYQYNDDELLTSVILPDATPADMTDNPVRQYLYESDYLAHGLTGIIDENGNRYSTFDYNSEGKAILSTHDNGADRNTIVYGENETTVTNALGKDTTYFFEDILGSNRLVRVEGHPTVNCAATTTTKTYDERGSVTEEVDRNGNITQFTYTHTGLSIDEYLYHVGLVTSRTEAADTSDERTTTIEWHPDFRLPLAITEPGRKIELTYDDNARLIERTEIALDTGMERTWLNQYNAIGLLTAIDGPRTDANDVTSLGYNSEAELTTISNALGHTTTILAHDDNGLPTTVQDPNGLVTHLSYDARLRLIAQRIISDAGEATTQISYDEKGNVIAVTLPDSQTLHYQYDLGSTCNCNATC